MAKPIKKTPKARKGPITRPEVVSFRITADQAKILKKIHEDQPASNVKSPNQRARKVLVDFLAGRLDYKNPDDQLRDLDLAGSK